MTRREFAAAAVACAPALWARNRWDPTRVTAITSDIGRSPADAIAFARAHHLEAVEVRYRPGTRREYWTLGDGVIKADGTELLNAGLKISCLNTSLLQFAWPGVEPLLGVAEPAEARDKRIAAEQVRWNRRLDDMQAIVRCARMMRLDKVTVFSGSRVANPEGMLEHIADTIGELAVVAEKERIFLLLENQAGQNVATPAELAAVMKLIPARNVGINWVPQSPYPESYSALPKKRILNVRLQAGGIPASGQPREGWKALLLALDRDDYKGRIGLETDPAAADPAMDELVQVVKEIS